MSKRTSVLTLVEAVMVAALLLAGWRLLVTTSAVRRLGMQNQSVRALNDSLSTGLRSIRLELRTVRSLLDGSVLAPNTELVGLDESGRRARINLAGLRQPILLHAFDTGCGTCYDNLPALAAIANANECEVRVINVMLSQLPGMFHSTDHSRLDSIPALSQPSGSAMSVLPLRRSTVAILIGPGGRIEGQWSDRLDSAAVLRAIRGMCRR